MIIGSGITIGGGIRITDILEATETFTTNGTFSTGNKQIFSATMLLVAGGGGGGTGNFGSPGGAGGVLANVNILSNIASNQSYSIIVGAGGTTGSAAGSNSTAFGYTAVGGGRGYNAEVPTTGYNGGSGAGGRRLSDQSDQGPGTGTAGQGSNGGYGYNDGSNSYVGTGGGGGAGGLGANATATSHGAGGAGIYDAISGTNTLYAQGGDGYSRFANGASQTGNVYSSYGAGGRGSSNTGTGATDGVGGICIIKYTYIPG